MEPALILTPMLHLSLLAALAVTPPPSQQGQPGLGELPPPPTGLEPSSALVASDGISVAPGRIPDDTSERARALWQAVVKGTGDSSAEPLSGFDLRFEIEVRTDNSLNSLGVAQYRFWSEKGYLRSEWKKSGRIQLRGPLGDWLIDKGVKTELIGRENTESRRELTDWVAIARNFLTLATPSSMRLLELATIDDLDAAFPTGTLVERANNLSWISVRSPDFRLLANGDASPSSVYRGYLGLEPDTGEIKLAILLEDRARRPVAESTILVEILNWTKVATRNIPKQVRVYRTHFKGTHWVFDDRPGADLYLLKNGVLDPKFKPEEFVP